MNLKEYAKQQGDYELIKTLPLHPGFKVLIERLEEIKAEYKEKLAGLLELILHSDKAEDKEAYRNMRVELLGIQAAIAIYADIRSTALENAEIVKQQGESVFNEGEGTPEHNV